MAQSDQNWPSEDEDFDAVIDGSPTKIDVNTDTDFDQPSEQTEEIVKDRVTLEDEPGKVEDLAPSQPEPSQEPEPEVPEPQEQPKATEPSETEVAPVVTPLATKSIKPPTISKPKMLGLRTAFEALLVLVIIGMGAYVMTLSSSKQDLQSQVTKLNSNPQIVAQKQSEAILKSVGALMQLPSGETPTIANVSDATKAKQQSAFFVDAQNGDKVLMYVKAQKAILYRPSTDKIVLVAPLTFTNDQATAKTATPATTAKTKQ